MYRKRTLICTSCRLFNQKGTRHEDSGVTLPFGAPLLIFLPAPTKFLLSPKKKKQKKVATFFL